MHTSPTIQTLRWGSTLALALLTLIAGCGKSQDQAALPSQSTTAPLPTLPAATPLPSPSIGATADDTTVTTKVKSALMDDASTQKFAVEVETIQGDVRLSGFVDSQAQIDQALKVARGVEGVKSVRNDLSVKK